jgi:gliding motility-associated-like protein
MRIAIFTILIFQFIIIKAQNFTVTTGLTPQQITGLISGPGVTITNVTSTCPPNASGKFVGGGSIIGIDSGLVMTTGSAANVVGGPATLATTNNLAPGDPLLAASAGVGNTFDACIYQFTIVPECDTLKINYVFGSDEYHVYINSFFDIFGFYVTGPNPAGGAYTNLNIANVPNLNPPTPITIGTINNGTTGVNGPCVNCQYFVNNTVQNVNCAYNGFTVPLTARIAVVPQSSYTFKLAIADAIDGNLDTGVFLTFEGLTCPKDTLIVSPDVVNICAGESVQFDASGSTTYTWTPATGLSNPNIPNPIATPNQTTTYYVTALGFTGIPRTDSVVINVSPQPSINDIQILPPLNDKIFCEGDSIALFMSSWSGSTIKWYQATTPTNYSEIASDTNFLVFQGLTQTTKFRAIVFSNCDTLEREITVTVLPKPIVNIASDFNICQGATNILLSNSNALGQTYSWTPGIYLNDSTIANPTFTAPTNTSGVLKYVLEVENGYGCKSKDSINISVRNLPLVEASANSSNCGDDNGRIDIAATNGTLPYMYTLNSGILVVDSFFINLSPGTYNIMVKDSVGCIGYDTITVSEVSDLDASFTWSSNNSFYNPGPPPSGAIPFELSFFNTTTGTYTNCIWIWGDGNIFNGFNPPPYTYGTEGNYTLTLVAYNVRPECADTFQITLEAIGTSAVKILPNVISPNGDGYNDFFDPMLQNIIKVNGKFYNRWGRLVYSWEEVGVPFKGVSDKGDELPDGTYYYDINAEGIDGVKHNIKGYVQISR